MLFAAPVEWSMVCPTVAQTILFTVAALLAYAAPSAPESIGWNKSEEREDEKIRRNEMIHEKRKGAKGKI